MTQLKNSMHTQCIGRYLADFPKSFQWMSPDLTLYYGKDEHFRKIEVKVINQKSNEELFNKTVAKDVKRDGSDALIESGKSTLISREDLEIGKRKSQAVIVNYYDNPYAIGQTHKLHLLINSSHVVLKSNSYEGVEDANGVLWKKLKPEMLRLADHIYSVSNPEKSGPGFCLGSVVVDSDNDFESADLTFGMAGHSDVTFDVWMDNQANDAKTLHERLQSADSMADGRRLTILRSRDLKIGGNPGQEELAKIVENRLMYQFVAESRPQHPSLDNEAINVSLNTGAQLSDGRYVDSSLTQVEALALWDQIIESFRPRPDAVHAPNHHHSR